jgi:hypothetical protein
MRITAADPLASPQKIKSAFHPKGGFFTDTPDLQNQA